MDLRTVELLVIVKATRWVISLATLLVVQLELKMDSYSVELKVSEKDALMVALMVKMRD